MRNTLERAKRMIVTSFISVSIVAPIAWSPSSAKRGNEELLFEANPTCAQLTAWISSPRMQLPTNLSELSELPPAYRKRAFDAVSPELKVSLVKEHLAQYLREEGGLSAPQRRIVSRTIGALDSLYAEAAIGRAAMRRRLADTTHRPTGQDMDAIIFPRMPLMRAIMDSATANFPTASLREVFYSVKKIGIVTSLNENARVRPVTIFRKVSLGSSSQSFFCNCGTFQSCNLRCGGGQFCQGTGYGCGPFQWFNCWGQCGPWQL